MHEYETESEEFGLPVEEVLVDHGDRRLALITGVAGAALLALLVVGAIVVGGDMTAWLVAVVAIVALVLVWIMYRNIRVWAGWGNPQLFLPSQSLHLGDHVVVRFRRAARGAADPAGLSVSAWLEAQEVIDSKAVPGPRDQVEGVYRAPLEQVTTGVVGRTVEADFALDVPLGAAPPSFSLGAYEVRWTLVVRIEAPNAPDDDSTFVLSVTPVVAHRMQSGGTGR